jgi:NitT/TauT family transport system substrate-binding protein
VRSLVLRYAARATRAALSTNGVAFVMAALACAGAAGAGAEPVKMRIQWANIPSHMTPLIPLAPKEIYRYYGKSYVVEPIFIAGSGPALTAIAAGEADMGGLSPQTVTLGIAEAKLDLRIIGQQISDVQGYGQSGFFVRPAEVKTLADLKGKIVAVNARGGAVDSAAIIVLRRAGMEVGRDYQFVEMRFPAMLPALEAKKVDIAFLTPPFNLQAAKMGLRNMFTLRDAYGESETLSWVGKADWIAKNRAALVDFLEDNIRLRRWIYDPQTRADAVKVLAQLAKQPVENFIDWAYTNQDSYRDPNAMVDTQRYQKNIDDLHREGVMNVRVDIKDHIDMSLAKEAASRIVTN